MKAANWPHSDENPTASEENAAGIVSAESIHVLSHEIRNPLSAILYAIESLQLRGLGCPEHATIERQVRHIIRLVENVRLLQLAGGGDFTLAKERLPMEAIVSQALEAIDPVVENRAQRLLVDMPPALIVEADRLWMTQVVTNLLDNASKYSAAGSTITVTGSRRDGRVLLSVQDDGVGIAASMIGRIFEPFVRIPQSPSCPHTGAGLGLTIVRGIVSMHGGRVRAHSAGTGSGTEFVVDLPAAPPRGPTPSSPFAPRAPT